ncbi:MAG TPA: TrkH family potassium uptake protein [Geoalkalibacter subterraneus]|uniref:TrkH family potassium uptake protein n=1 Tax=Geoalkalibacter subterraneus TaxID=483547 RepID=A0A831LKQ5_9BACT|nr:TrkH family potassium uptake protein [Geoalkalibacter subterraneus]
MGSQLIELSYAVRLRVIGKYFGQLSLVVAVLTLVPLAVALGYAEFGLALRYAVVAAVMGGIGMLLARIRAGRRVQPNEAMVLAALTFLITPLLMTYPMMGAGLSFDDALFEAISAATTTGLSTLATVEDKSPVFLFARSWMQWYGGLGVVVLSLALLMRPGITAKSLAVTEEVTDDLVGGTKAYARRVVIIYAILTGIGIAALLLAGSGLFNAVVYTLAAVSTGGFAPHDASLGHFSGGLIPWLTILTCLACALPLALYGRRGRWRAFFQDLQLRGLLLLSLFVSLTLSACLYFYMHKPLDQALFHGPLLALSAQTTAGFATFNLGELDPVSKLVTILSMAVGGGIGSTAGGIKILRFIILLRLVQLTLVKTCLPPHAVLDQRLGGHRLADDQIRQALLLFLLFFTVIAFSWLPFLMLGYDPLDALFDVVSATGTVGLSCGVVGPDLPVVLKAVLCVNMLMGRLEILVWLVILYPRTWFGNRVEES